MRLAAGTWRRKYRVSNPARGEGYFRREWNLAMDRMLDIASRKTFLVRVLIEGRQQAAALAERVCRSTQRHH